MSGIYILLSALAGFVVGGILATWIIVKSLSDNIVALVRAKRLLEDSKGD